MARRRHVEPHPAPFKAYGPGGGRGDSRLMSHPDQHQDFELNILADGSLTYLMGERDVTLTPGRLVLFWGAVPHQVIRIDDARGLIHVHMPMSWVTHWSLDETFIGRLLAGAAIFESDAACARADLESMDRWRRYLMGDDEALWKVAELELHARLRRLAHATRGGRTHDAPPETPHAIEPVLRVAQYVAGHYLEPLTVPQLAQTVGWTPEYTMSMFKRRFGVTITQYISRYRVWHAQHLLASTNETILSLAYQSGFGSVSRFTTVFKKSTGMTARQFRKRLAETPPGRAH